MPYHRAVRTCLAFVVALTLLSGCGGSARGPSDVSLPEDRLELPEFDYGGYRTLLANLEGTPVVVNFWGSWCPPCRDEAPFLAKVSREFEGRVQFLGVNMVDAREPARDFIEEFDLPYPSIFDPRDTIRTGLGVYGQPITRVYSSDGTLSWEHVGTASEDDLREEIKRVL